MAEIDLNKEESRWKRNGGMQGLNGTDSGTSSLGTVSDTAILEAMKSDSDAAEDEWLRKYYSQCKSVSDQFDIHRMLHRNIWL